MQIKLYRLRKRELKLKVLLAKQERKVAQRDVLLKVAEIDKDSLRHKIGTLQRTNSLISFRINLAAENMASLLARN